MTTDDDIANDAPLIDPSAPQKWGPFDHIVDPNLGPPHDLYCEDPDCEVVVGTRQLPPGGNPDTPSGLLCAGCSTRRKEADLAVGSP